MTFSAWAAWATGLWVKRLDCDIHRQKQLEFEYTLKQLAAMEIERHYAYYRFLELTPEEQGRLLDNVVRQVVETLQRDKRWQEREVRELHPIASLVCTCNRLP